MKNNLITGVLLILAGVMITLHFKQDGDIKDQLHKSIYELQRELERTKSSLRQSSNSRDSILGIGDSLLSVTLDLREQLKGKDREIAKIKGTYDKVPVDSLAEIMNTRARNANR